MGKRMIFSNVNLTSFPKDMGFGTIHLITLGEDGRGRKQIRLVCPEDTHLEVGCNPDYTIGTTKSGRPRIDKRKDNTIYLLLSTKGLYTRRGNGWVGSYLCNTAKYEVLAKGNGADGDAGRIGTWDVLLVKVSDVPENDWLRIRTGGGGYGTSPQWVHISRKGIFLFEDTDAAVEFADSIGVLFPLNIENDINGERFDCLGD